MSDMRRRDFITLFGGAAAWPLAARAQQGDGMRRIGVLMNRAADDREGHARLVAFQQALQQLGWSEGRNMRMDTRWGENDIDRQRRYAAELVALAPDVILASGVSACRHCNMSPAPCRSCSRPSATRSASASSIAWPGRAATSPAS